MNERYERQINYFIGLFLLQLLIVTFFYYAYQEFLPFILIILLVADSIILLAQSFFYYRQLKSRQLSITQILGKEAKDALVFGDIGIVTFDENYNITWMSDMFDPISTRFIGEKISNWIPQTSELVRGNQHEVIVEYRNYILKISRFKEGNTLFVKDVTRQEHAIKDYQDNRVVLGVIHLDNYEDETMFDDEQKQALIDIQIRQPIINWAKNHGMFIRRVRSDRFLLILNEAIFEQLLSENFDILTKIRNASTQYDLSVTLSMAFSKGTNDFIELESMVNRALELTQGRGGDQVAVQTFNQEIQYYGLGSQAQEKTSKVRVRVLAHTIRDMILNSENVLIAGHKTMDFDCFGAAIGMSRIVQSYQKPVAIISESGGLEEKLERVYQQYGPILRDIHTFVSEDEALELLRPSTLLIMVDHHSHDISNAQQVIESVKKIAIIDHHRRTTDFRFNPALVYIETAFSSTCEMVVELFRYQRRPLELEEVEATIMFTGIVIDTNHFRARSGARTFEAIAELRRLKASPQLADSFIKDTFDEFELKSRILANAQRIGDIVLVDYDESIINRTIMSQVADETLKVENIEASFVIGKLDDNKVGVSARSKGKINVQVLMEELGGGGHFNAAAMQTEEHTVAEVTEQVKTIIEERIPKDESHITS